MRFSERRFQRKESTNESPGGPGGIATVDARVIEADATTRGIAQVRFPPQSWLISGSGLELQTRAHQLLQGGVQIIELEVHHDAAVL